MSGPNHRVRWRLTMGPVSAPAALVVSRTQLLGRQRLLRAPLALIGVAQLQLM